MGAFLRVFRKGRARRPSAKPSRSTNDGGLSSAAPTEAEHGQASSIEPFFNFLPGHPDFQEDKTASELRLPEASAYTLAFLGPVLYSLKGTSRLNSLALIWGQAQRCYLLFFLSLSLQGFIVHRLWEPYLYQPLTGASPLSCVEDASMLKLACTSMFSIAILFDLHETWLMLDWLRNVRDAPALRPLTVDAETGELDPSWGMTRLQKWSSRLLVLLPKASLAVILWFEGVAFISLSDTEEDMILNMLGLAFVIEIDEILFISLSTRHEQEALASLPGVRPRPRRARLPRPRPRRARRVRLEAAVHPAAEPTDAVVPLESTAPAAATEEPGAEPADAAPAPLPAASPSSCAPSRLPPLALRAPSLPPLAARAPSLPSAANLEQSVKQIAAAGTAAGGKTAQLLARTGASSAKVFGSSEQLEIGLGHFLMANGLDKVFWIALVFALDFVADAYICG